MRLLLPPGLSLYNLRTASTTFLANPTNENHANMKCCVYEWKQNVDGISGSCCCIRHLVLLFACCFAHTFHVLDSQKAPRESLSHVDGHIPRIRTRGSLSKSRLLGALVGEHTQSRRVRVRVSVSECARSHATRCKSFVGCRQPSLDPP